MSLENKISSSIFSQNNQMELPVAKRSKEMLIETKTNKPKQEDDINAVRYALSLYEDATPEQKEKNIETIFPSKKEINRREFMTGLGKAAITAVVTGNLTYNYLEGPEITEDVFLPEETSEIDSTIAIYSGEGKDYRIKIASGDSNSGHKDKNQATNQVSPPDKFVIDEMEKKHNVHWQLIYVSKNGSEQDQILHQLDLPIVQIALGREVIYDKIPQEDKQRPVLIYYTENSHKKMGAFLKKNNPKQAIIHHKFYPVTIKSQKDIEELEEMFAQAKAVDMTDSSGGNTVANFFTDNPENFKLVETVKDNENPLNPNYLLASSEMLRESKPRLDLTEEEKIKFFNKIQTENNRTEKEGGRKIEIVNLLEVPDCSTQTKIVMKEERKNNVIYQAEDVKPNKLTQIGLQAVARGINNRKIKAYEKFKKNLQENNEKMSFTVRRIKASKDIYHQHYTEEGYAEMAEEMLRRSRYD